MFLFQKRGNAAMEKIFIIVSSKAGSALNAKTFQNYETREIHGKLEDLVCLSYSVFRSCSCVLRRIATVKTLIPNPQIHEFRFDIESFPE